MTHPDQNQHIVPQVYLKKFGYIDQIKKGQPMISVMKRGEKFTRQKSIESFMAITNHFDIKNLNRNTNDVQRAFEDLNGNLESKYNDILEDLDNNRVLSDQSYAYLLQFIANLFVRSSYHREWTLGLLNHENKENFLKMIMAHRFTSYEAFQKISEHPLFRSFMDNSSDDVLNMVLLQFTEYLMKRIQHLEVVIIESQEEKPWWTSSNPVVLNNRTQKFEFFTSESEIYFPLSPTTPVLNNK